MNEMSPEIDSQIEEALENQAEILNLSNLGITELPTKLSQLTQLKYLDLSSNQIKELPEFIGHFGQLQRLNLRDNQLQRIPEDLIDLKFLEILDLRNNPLPIPQEILFHYNNSKIILDYYFRTHEKINGF